MSLFTPYSLAVKYLRSALVTWLIIVLIITVIALTAVFQTKIVKALAPVVHWAHATPGGFLIPIAILIVLSFPPLFGQEFVAILCGMAWGPWVGFAIVSIGSLLGEIVTFL